MTDPPTAALLLTHLAATLCLVGVIWFVQLVHYPLMGQVGRDEAVGYERQHTRRTGWVVAPLMLAELATAGLLLGARPTGVPLWAAALGVALLAVVWASTWAVQIPCHRRLSVAFDPVVHRRLVRTNWLRTACWSLRGLLALAMTAADRSH